MGTLAAIFGHLERLDEGATLGPPHFQKAMADLSQENSKNWIDIPAIERGNNK